MSNGTRKPLVGTPVHYFETAGGLPLAAIITDVGTDGIVNLAVFGRNGLAGNATSVPFSETTGNAGRWTWTDSPAAKPAKK